MSDRFRKRCHGRHLTTNHAAPQVKKVQEEPCALTKTSASFDMYRVSYTDGWCGCELSIDLATARILIFRPMPCPT
jgi:hypothetical protein